MARNNHRLTTVRAASVPAVPAVVLAVVPAVVQTLFKFKKDLWIHNGPGPDPEKQIPAVVFEARRQSPEALFTTDIEATVSSDN